MPSMHHRPGALRRAVALSAALSTAFLLAACDDLSPTVPDGFDQPGPSPSSDPAPADDDLGLTWGPDGVATLGSGAVLDRATGHVELPSDRYLESWEEVQTLEMARNAAVAACARLSGLDVQAVRWEIDPLSG
ncbi:hypothetical protein [Antribacter gilvus]|uniref:hypothetical protein n=1 Tax=Antribacter gilvus TaxID=2304675 RepID=UPI000F785291|nr:hypothetical protein [Antribacter gilvus]